MADLDRRAELQRAAALWTHVAFAWLAEVGEAGLVVAPGLDAAQVPAVAVRSGDELPFAQGLVGNHRALEADRARATHRPRRTRRGSPRRQPAGTPTDSASSSFVFAQTVVSADEHEHERAVADDHRHRLRRRGSVDRRGTRRAPRSSSTPASPPPPARPARPGSSAGRATAARYLDVGGVVAVLAGHEHRSRPSPPARGSRATSSAHDPGLRLDVVRLEPAALEDPLVRARGAARSSREPPPRRDRTSRRPS